ncbi:hypothetical protein [Haloferax sp. Q22]|uniref:hypothetical protein n=1 Tax=Haloferax sp. (strain Q22) TaxID=1526048 RepID=UPI000AAD052C|nr:hypothetical protein [Haloferax sp. Q22]
MNVDDVLEEVSLEFSERPFEFFNENDIQARVYEALRNELRAENNLKAKWDPYWADNPIRLSHNRNYVEETYHERIRENFERLQNSYGNSPMSRVHTEVRISQAFKGDLANIVDIAVLNQPIDRPPRLINGKIRIEDEAIDALIELKRPQDPIVPLTISPEVVADTPRNELQNAVNLEKLGLANDIAELEDLAGVNTYQSAYLMICSPFDLLCCGNVNTTSVHQKRGRAAIAEIQSRCEETSVIYSYPGGVEWIVEP